MKKTEKIRYEVDPHNRLVYEKTGKKSGVPRFRTVLDGKFEIDKDNSVTYHVKKSQGYDTPQKVRLQGRLERKSRVGGKSFGVLCGNEKIKLNNPLV